APAWPSGVRLALPARYTVLFLPAKSGTLDGVRFPSGESKLAYRFVLPSTPCSVANWLAMRVRMRFVCATRLRFVLLIWTRTPLNCDCIEALRFEMVRAMALVWLETLPPRLVIWAWR